MTNSRDVIIRLKAVWNEKKAQGLQQSDILRMIEENGDYLSKSSISRVFADGSEDDSDRFSYENTLRPIAKVLLDMENIEDTDDMDTKALKALLKYKLVGIEDLEMQIERLETALDNEKLKSHEKLEMERAQIRTSIDFLKNQIELKDKRMDQLLEAVFMKDQQSKQMLDRFIKCDKCTRE